MTDAKNVDTDEQLENERGFHLGREMRDDQNVENERLEREDDLGTDRDLDGHVDRDTGMDDAGMDGPHHGMAEPDMAGSDVADDPVDRQVIDPDTTPPMTAPAHEVTETPTTANATATPAPASANATAMPAAPTTSGTPTRSMDLIAAGDVAQYRDDWRTVQHGFVDDPAAAVRDADALVGRLFDTITTRINEQRAALSAHRSDDAADHTEQLRQALREYRTMFEQLLPAQRP
ncbi:MAG TPA: hypothetical protein VFW65_25135 [Pseudonocardiaceae bacterium]|nr:hypothetical protein [Pseudonocardiaceae bacterium]